MRIGDNEGSRKEMEQKSLRNIIEYWGNAFRIQMIEKQKLLKVKVHGKRGKKKTANNFGS